MKLLLDQNLPDQLLEVLAPAFPGSTHVRLIGLAAAPDDVVWRHARDHEFAIVSKDTDFYELSLLNGTPPKVVQLSCGNATNRFLRALVERHVPEIRTFLDDPDVTCIGRADTASENPVLRCTSDSSAPAEFRTRQRSQPWARRRCWNQSLDEVLITP